MEKSYGLITISPSYSGIENDFKVVEFLIPHSADSICDFFLSENVNFEFIRVTIGNFTEFTITSEDYFKYNNYLGNKIPIFLNSSLTDNSTDNFALCVLPYTQISIKIYSKWVLENLKIITRNIYYSIEDRLELQSKIPDPIKHQFQPFEFFGGMIKEVPYLHRNTISILKIILSFEENLKRNENIYKFPRQFMYKKIWIPNSHPNNLKISFDIGPTIIPILSFEDGNTVIKVFTDKNKNNIPFCLYSAVFQELQMTIDCEKVIEVKAEIDLPPPESNKGYLEEIEYYDHDTKNEEKIIICNGMISN